MRIRHVIPVLPALALVAVTVVSGCNIYIRPEPLVDRVQLNDSMRAWARAEVAQYTEPPKDNYKTIQQIEATSCRYWFTEPPATKEDAIDQLRYKAAPLGANGILDVVCDSRKILNLVKDCWSSVTCRGMAIRVGG